MSTGHKDRARLAVDIGGTFTDLALEWDGKRESVKVLTTPRAPEEGVLTGVEEILALAKLKAADLGLIIHGTTLATNAIIERKGALTALIATEGFRDTIDIAYESRYDQYDIFIEKPPALVPRWRRFTVPERVDVKGRVRLRLDLAAVEASAEAFVEKDDEGKVHLTRIVLRPCVTIRQEEEREKADKFIRRAEETCLIARAMRATVELEPEIRVAS